MRIAYEREKQRLEEMLLWIFGYPKLCGAAFEQTELCVTRHSTPEPCSQGSFFVQNKGKGGSISVLTLVRTLDS